MLASGLLVGIAAGIAMLAVTMTGAMSQGLAAVHPVQLIAESLTGPGAFDGVATKVEFGALVHLAVSAALGVLFAAIVPADFPRASAVGVGVAFALFTLMFTMGWIVPWVSPEFRLGMQDIGGTWVIAHAVFGAVLGTTPALRRWIARQAMDASAPAAGRTQPTAEPVARATATTR